MGKVALQRFYSVLCPQAAQFSIVTYVTFRAAFLHSFFRVIFHVVSQLHQMQPWDSEWLQGPEGGCGAFFAHIVIPALLGRTVQESDPRDIPVGLFLERMAKRSPFCLQVKTEICVLLLRADVRTPILCRSLGCSLGSDYLSQFPFLCVSLWLMKAKRGKPGT